MSAPENVKLPARFRAAAIAALMGAAMTLSACAAEPVAEEPQPTPEPQPVVSEEPEEVEEGPVELSLEEAGERFLNIVCPSNFALQSFSDSLTESDADVYFSGGSPDPAPVAAAAASAREVAQRSAILLGDPNYVWPDAITADITVIRQTLLADVATYNALAGIQKWEEAWFYNYPPLTTEQQAAAPSVRATLGLSADTTASCAGREDGHELLSE